MTGKSEKQKMLAGEPYLATDPELAQLRERASQWMDRYNARIAGPDAEKLALLREIMAEVGEETFIRPPFFCDYGENIRLGSRIYVNFNCVILDVAPVVIGDGTLIGPGAQILTAEHPVEAGPRATGIESGRPVHIGRDVWIGAGALILPGVTVGDGAVIGAGAVVTRDVGAGVRVAGSPARALPAAQHRPEP
ncbi:sugar O-acetyltransferase [Falsirhodobacter deserti]|uniref:sugar O-acetyltransferase n=1 Tax=Falsirhodobacter deserti TaxID=1365611 RepID=UPI000FE32B10|nr:sugar O-acetyltransferase [Falsirhodobacter deserti]